jgi:hypothetical protein
MVAGFQIKVDVLKIFNYLFMFSFGCFCLFFSYSIETGMHTERMPDGLLLIIPMLQERHAGNYTCTAKYANTEELSKTVNIKTFGKSRAAKPYSRLILEVAVTSI